MEPNDQPVLLVANQELGIKALLILKEVGIEPEVVRTRSEIGEALVELWTPDGNFDGLPSIKGYVQRVRVSKILEFWGKLPQKEKESLISRLLHGISFGVPEGLAA